jgi:WhiB family redox-sensing transcriptional regulator
VTLPDLPDALCQSVDPELFFPEVGSSSTDAKRVCRRCDVQLECLMWALEHDERHGVWGGLGPGQRAHLQKRGNAA